jgi:hypothetical protein
VTNQDSQTPWCFWSGSNKVRRGIRGVNHEQPSRHCH